LRRDRQRLEDILEAIERIEKYASGGRATFDRDELVQIWVLHHLQIIGEAVRGLSDEIRSAHPDIPWAQIAAMRNILVHDYFGIDLEEVWAAVVRDLPHLKAKIAAALVSAS
jgi:uncharacterized protein with HEPN domain